MEGVAAMGDMMASSARACPWGRKGTSRMVFVIEERTGGLGTGMRQLRRGCKLGHSAVLVALEWSGQPVPVRRASAC